MCMHIWKILWKIVDIPISEFVWRTNFAIVGFINCVRYKPRSDRWSRRNFVICRLTHMCVSLAVHCEIIGRTTTLFWFISRSGSSLDFASFFLLLRWKKYILNVWKEMVSNATCVCLSWAKRPRSYLIS